MGRKTAGTVTAVLTVQWTVQEAPKRLNFPPGARLRINSACDRGSVAMTSAISHAVRQTLAERLQLDGRIVETI